MATKLNIENLMPGSEAWWHQQSAVNHPERYGDADGANEAKNNGYIPFKTEKKGVRTTYRLGVPGATIYPEGVDHTVDMPQPSLNSGAVPQVSVPQTNPQMPTRTRGGGYRQPGVSENELNDFMAQGNGEVVDLTGPNEMNKSQAQKIGKQRADGVLPEQKPAVNRHQRTAVDRTKANPDNVKAIQEELGLDGGGVAATQGTGATYNSYDDILKLMSHNAVSDAELARRQRSREIVAGLGDTISAIANMWATTKGAPNSYDNSKGMSATAQERYARMLAERKAQQDQILNYYRVKRQAEQEKENQEYRNSMLEIRRKEAERRQKQADEESARKDAITKSRVERDEAAKTAAENKTLEAMGKSHLATRYNYYLEVEGRDPEEARKLAIRDADDWLEEQRKLNNEKTQSQTNKNNQPKGSGGGSSKKKGKAHTGRKGKVYGSGKGKKRLY